MLTVLAWQHGVTGGMKNQRCDAEWELGQNGCFTCRFIGADGSEHWGAVLEAMWIEYQLSGSVWLELGMVPKNFLRPHLSGKKQKKITYRYWNELLIAHHVKEFLEHFQRILMMGGNTIYLVYDLIASLTLCIAMSLNLLGAKIRCSCFLLPLALLPLLLLLLIIYCYLVSVLFGMTMYSIISYLISVRCNWTTLAS